MKTSSKIILGVLGAATAGVIVGMLVSPEKTKALCDRVKSNIADLSDSIKSQVVKSAKIVDEHIQEATA